MSEYKSTERSRYISTTASTIPVTLHALTKLDRSTCVREQLTKYLKHKLYPLNGKQPKTLASPSRPGLSVSGLVAIALSPGRNANEFQSGYPWKPRLTIKYSNNAKWR